MKKITMILICCLLIASVIGCTDASNTSSNTNVSESKVVDGTFHDTGYWDVPPAYNGNKFAVGGVGEAKHWIYGVLGVWEPLNQSYRGYLAENIEISDDQIVVTIKDGIVWEDGTPFTTKDIEADFILEGGVVGNPNIWKGLDSINIVDDHTIEFNLNDDSSELTVYYILQAKLDVAYHVYEAWYEDSKKILDIRKQDWTASLTEDEAFKALSESIKDFKPELPLGYGPFKLVRVTADEMILERVENYPGVESIEFKTVNIKRRTGNEAQTALLQGGQIDFTETALSPDLVDAIKGQNPGMNVQTAPYFATITVVFNQGTGLGETPLPTADLNVRKAIAYVLNRDKIRELAFYFGDTMNNMNGMIPAMGEKWVDISSFESYANDLEKAESLLIESGYTKENGTWKKDGKALEINISSRSGYTDFNIASEEISRQLNDFGIQSAPIVIPSETFSSTVTAGDFDLVLEFGAYFSRVSPWQVYERFYGENGYVNKIGAGQSEGIDSSGQTIVFDDVLNEFARKSTSDERRKEIIEALAYITNQTLPSIDISEKTGLYFMNDKGVASWPTDQNLMVGLTSDLGAYRVLWMLDGVLKAK